MSDTNHSAELDHIAKQASEKAKNEYIKKLTEPKDEGIPLLFVIIVVALVWYYWYTHR